MRSDWGAKPGHEALICHQRAWVLFHVKDSVYWTLELMLSGTSLNDPTNTCRTVTGTALRGSFETGMLSGS